MMITYIDKASVRVRRIVKSFFELSFVTRIAVLLVVIGIPLAIYGNDKNIADQENRAEQNSRFVTIEKVSDIAGVGSNLRLLGTVVSVSEARVRTEVGGGLVGVYKKLGDYVSAGTILAEFDNEAERAAVLSAEGAYESATAGKTIAGISLLQSDKSLLEVRTQALNVISSTFTGLDDAVRTKTDNAWTNPLTRDAKLRVTIADAKTVLELEDQRVQIESLLLSREQRNKVLTTASNLIDELDAVEYETNIIKDYLDKLALGFNRALPDGNASISTIEGYKSSTAQARASVGGLLSGLTNARMSLNNTLSGNLIAEKNSARGSSDAQIKSALGNLRGAKARLEKTIVRSPISGTINSLNMQTGDFVSPYTEVAVIANNSALEIVSYITEEDALEIEVGGSVLLENEAMGVISRIAPALDPNTRKIEIRIGVTKNTIKLVNGTTQRIEIKRIGGKSETAEVRIPLSALKITPNGSVVFSVSTTSRLISHEVKMGALLGEFVVITDGLSRDMEIVTDARGLQNDMAVSVK